MANTLRFKRGLVAGIPTALAGEPLFTTDTFDLYIGNGTTNTRFQKYIASGTTLQYLRGDGSLATFPTNIVTGTGVAGQVAYWSGASTQVGSNNLFWDATNNRLGIGTATPQAMLDVAQGIRVNSAGIVTSSFANGLNMGTWDAIGYNAAGNTVVIGGYRASQWSAIGLYTANTLRATLDSSGNLLVGGTSVYAATITSYATAGRSGGIGIRNSAGTAAGFFGTYAAGSGSGSTDIFVEAAGFMLFSAGGSERMKLYSATGNLAIGSTASDTTQRLQVTGDTLLKGAGNTSATTALAVQNSDGNNLMAFVNSGSFLFGQNAQRGYISITDSITTLGLQSLTIQSSLTISNTRATSAALVNGSLFITRDGIETSTVSSMTNLLIVGHRPSEGFAPTSGTALFTAQTINPIINQTGGANGITRGLWISPTLTAAANWRSIETSNNSGWSYYGAGTANSYFGGSVGIGTTALTGYNLRIIKNITGAGFPFNVSIAGAVQSDVTNTATYVQAISSTQATTFTLPQITLFNAEQGTFGAGSIVTNQIGFNVANLTGATNNFAFVGNIASGTGRWNLYMNGTAANYLAGSLGIGTTTPSRKLSVVGTTDIISYSNGTTTGYLYSDNNGVGLFNGATATGTGIYARTSSILDLYYNGNIGLRLNNLGRILINSTSDTGEQLQVNGTMKVTGASTFGGETSIVTGGNAILNIDGLSTSTSGLIIKGSGVERGRISFSNSTTMRFFIGSSVTQFLEIDATTRAATFSSSVTGGTFIPTNGTAPTNGMYLNNTNSLAFSTNSTFRLVIGSTGIVGVGIANPSLGYGDGVGVELSPVGYIQSYRSQAVSATFGRHTTTGSIQTLFYGATSATAAQIGAIGTDGTGLTLSGGAFGTTHLTIASTGAATFNDSVQAATAIAIGTTPDTNKPFKILKNINATVGINFENTSTSSLAFSAIQMGTDVTGGTKFTNLVYASSGVSASGVYNPDGTSLINNGGGGLNFLGTPTRFYTGGGNGVLRLLHDNEGTTQFTATTPTTNATDGYKQYSADVVAGNAAPHFRTENGAVIKLYQETTGVGNAIFSAGGGTGVLDDSTFDGYTLRQIVKALRNQGILA